MAPRDLCAMFRPPEQPKPPKQAKALQKSGIGPDCSQHAGDTEHRDQSPEIIGEHVQAHLGCDALQSFRQEVCRAHPGLDRPVWMLDRGAPNSHGIRALLKAHLHLVEHILMLPTGHSPLRARRALFLEVTALAVRAPVPMQFHAFFDACETQYQGFACRAAILILVRVVNEVGLVESAVGLGPDVFVGGTKTEMPAS